MQPELTDDAASNVHTMYGAVAEAKDVTRVVVKGHFDELLVDKDCKRVRKAFVMFKTDDKNEWSRKELDTNRESFQEDLYLPDFCKKYKFQLIFDGFPGTESINLELETRIGPADIDETGLEKCPQCRICKL